MGALLESGLVGTVLSTLKLSKKIQLTNGTD